MKDNMALQRVREAAEKAKCELSSSLQVLPNQKSELLKLQRSVSCPVCVWNGVTVLVEEAPGSASLWQVLF